MKLLARFLILFAAAITAHEFSGGQVIQSPLLLIQLVFITAVVYCVRSIKLEGPALALVVLLVQSVSHFIIGNGTYSNNLLMTSGHLISGFTSYFGIKYFENIWDFFSAIFSLILPTILVVVGQTSKLKKINQTNFRRKIYFSAYIESLSFRGPPIEWKSI